MTETGQGFRTWMTVCVVVLVAVAALWLIRSEGEKNRQVLREESDKLKQEIRDASGNSVKDAAKGAIRLPVQVLDEARDVILSDKSTEVTRDGQVKEKTAPEIKRRGPGQTVADIFKFGQDLAKAADGVGQEILALSDEEQKRVGETLNKLIRKNHKVSTAPGPAARVMDLAGPLLQRCKRNGVEYTFTVLDSPQVNAFAHVGGYIYVNTGLLEFIAGDGELEFVLGHEIGHVELKHCSRKLTYFARASKLGGDLGGNLVQMAYHLIAVGYSEKDEFEADEWGFRSLVQMGRDRDRALALPRRFVEKEKREGRRKEKASSPTAVEAVVQGIDNHFQTHPAAEERLRRLERLKINPGRHRGGGE